MDSAKQPPPSSISSSTTSTPPSSISSSTTSTPPSSALLPSSSSSPIFYPLSFESYESTATQLSLQLVSLDRLISSQSTHSTSNDHLLHLLDEYGEQVDKQLSLYYTSLSSIKQKIISSTQTFNQDLLDELKSIHLPNTINKYMTTFKESITLFHSTTPLSQLQPLIDSDETLKSIITDSIMRSNLNDMEESGLIERCLKLMNETVVKEFEKELFKRTLKVNEGINSLVDSTLRFNLDKLYKKILRSCNELEEENGKTGEKEMNKDGRTSKCLEDKEKKEKTMNEDGRTHEDLEEKESEENEEEEEKGKTGYSESQFKEITIPGDSLTVRNRALMANLTRMLDTPSKQTITLSDHQLDTQNSNNDAIQTEIIEQMNDHQNSKVKDIQPPKHDHNREEKKKNGGGFRSFFGMVKKGKKEAGNTMNEKCVDGREGLTENKELETRINQPQTQGLGRVYTIQVDTSNDESLTRDTDLISQNHASSDQQNTFGTKNITKSTHQLLKQQSLSLEPQSYLNDSPALPNRPITKESQDPRELPQIPQRKLPPPILPVRSRPVLSTIPVIPFPSPIPTALLQPSDSSLEPTTPSKQRNIKIPIGGVALMGQGGREAMAMAMTGKQTGPKLTRLHSHDVENGERDASQHHQQQQNHHQQQQQLLLQQSNDFVPASLDEQTTFQRNLQPSKGGSFRDSPVEERMVGSAGTEEKIDCNTAVIEDTTASSIIKDNNIVKDKEIQSQKTIKHPSHHTPTTPIPLLIKRKENSLSGDDKAVERMALEWLNNHSKESVTSLDGLSDGLLLINALQHATGESVGRFTKRPILEVHKIDNLSVVFRFLKEKEVDTRFIRPQDVINGDKSKILVLFISILRAFPL